MSKWTDPQSPVETPVETAEFSVELEAEAEAKTEGTGDKKTIEGWGEAKGMWPQRALPGSPAGRDYWKFAAAKTWAKWSDGQEVTEAEFDKAIADALAQVSR